MKKFTSMCIISVFAVNLVACAGATKQDMGVVAGGLAGGLLGSQFGGGSGAVAMTIGGAMLGALAGGSIGRNMDKTDQMEMQRAVTSAPVGRTVAWQNSDTGNSYQVTPTRAYRAQGQQCREYTTNASIGGKRQEIYGTACKQADGSWKIKHS